MSVSNKCSPSEMINDGDWEISVKNKRVNKTEIQCWFFSSKSTHGGVSESEMQSSEMITLQ